MGDPRRLRKKYESPRKLWDKGRIEEEKRLREQFGLKNAREVWKAKTILRKYRRIAKKLVGLPEDERKSEEKMLISKLQKLGLLQEGATLDDVLSLKVEDILERRLQTIVWRKGLARTIKQARQFITHGHIAIDGRKVTVPGMIVDKEREEKIGWYGEPIQIQKGEEGEGI